MTADQADSGLDHILGFREGFASIVPRILVGDIIQVQAARELGIRVQPWKRYVKLWKARA